MMRKRVLQIDVILLTSEGNVVKDSHATSQNIALTDEGENRQH